MGLEPKELPKRIMAGYWQRSQGAWFWTPKWQAGEREVDAHIAAGEIEEFDSIDDMFRALNE